MNLSGKKRQQLGSELKRNSFKSLGLTFTEKHRFSNKLERHSH